MTADEARDRVSAARWRLDDAMRSVSVPAPDWGSARSNLDAAALLCMDLAAQCERERSKGDADR